ncbi:MAG: DJ-1/PfpI family protein [Vicinamibacteria bacterium]|nr:DJ-1/PfpI family protein [Vicinamibacteria bacterium]
MNRKVLCLIVNGFEEIEAIAPIDLLRRAGAEVVLASLTGEKLVTGRSGVTVQTDVALSDVKASDFDLLLIPGGPGVDALRKDGRPALLARQYVDSGKPVAAICAAPAVLADAGLLEGRRFTAHASVHGELPQVLPEERVVEDGLIVTSRGPGTTIEFSLALIRRLFDDSTAEKVARAIMV